MTGQDPGTGAEDAVGEGAHRAEGAHEGDRQPASKPARQPGASEVLLLAAVVVVIVLAAAGLTAVLPRDAQGVVFHTPLLITVLIAGTAFVLWRILRAPRP
jgi:hypothetical protein